MDEKAAYLYKYILKKLFEFRVLKMHNARDLHYCANRVQNFANHVYYNANRLAQSGKKMQNV